MIGMYIRVDRVDTNLAGSDIKADRSCQNELRQLNNFGIKVCGYYVVY